MFYLEFKSLFKKFKEWGFCKWNLCDGCVILLFFVVVGFCLNLEIFKIGYIFYCFDIMLWIIWVFDIFLFSKVLGLYVVMIG